MNLNKRNLIMIGLLLFLVIIFSLVYAYRYPSKEEKINEKVTLVNDYSRFFTVSNAASSYINYLAKKDTDALLKLLSADYQEINNINQSNVLSKLTNLNENVYKFDARKMYQEKLSSHIIKYYIYGHLSESIMDTYVKPIDYYLILILDTDYFTYSITPDNGNIFKGVDNK